MLGKELKETRIALGQTQKQFAKSFFITQSHLSKMEAGIMRVPSYIKDKFIKVIKEEKCTTPTNKKFSKELFLDNMLTGNKVVDEIYLNSDWLDNFDGEKVYMDRIDIYFINLVTKELKIGYRSARYFIKKEKIFYCKSDWIE